MYKILLVLLFIESLSAKTYLPALKACQTFNNMKHSLNSGDLRLKIGKKYRVLKFHKKQVLIVIEDKKPAQRWVNEECISSGNDKHLVKNSLTVTNENLLALTWNNAFCEHKQNSKQCKKQNRKAYNATNFTIHGLWPQPRNNQYCKLEKNIIKIDKKKKWDLLPKLELSKQTRTDVKKYVAGYDSYLHRHEWYKHGTCYNNNQDLYFQDSIILLKQINDSSIGKYFKQNIGKTVSINRVRLLFDKEFGKTSGSKVAFVCKKGLLKELQISLKGKGTDLSVLLKNSIKIRSKCTSAKLDKVGF